MVATLYTIDVLKTARQLGSATLHEASGKKGALPSGIKPLRSGWRIAAPVFTVAGPVRDNLWLHRAIYAAPAGSVLVHECGNEDEAGYWGGIMANAARQRHLAGLVTQGGVRDLEELRELDLPIFAHNVSIQGTSKRVDAAGSLGTSIVLGAVLVRTGDLLVADDDGVVVIAHKDVALTIAAGVVRANEEKEIIERIQRGESTLDIYNLGAI